MATRPGQVVSQVTSPRKPWRASSRIGVSGFMRGDVLRPADLVVDGDVAGGQEHREEDADLQDRAGPLVRDPEHDAERPPGGDHRHAERRDPEREQPEHPARELGAEHERRGTARTTVVKVARTRLGQHRPDVAAPSREPGREEQPVVEARSRCRAPC